MDDTHYNKRVLKLSADDVLAPDITIFYKGRQLEFVYAADFYVYDDSRIDTSEAMKEFLDDYDTTMIEDDEDGRRD